MNLIKIALIAFTFSIPSGTAFATSFSEFTPSELEDFCTKNHPCYYNGGWHHIDPDVAGNNAGNNDWKYSLADLIVGVAYPVIFRIGFYVADWSIDWAIYRFHCLRGLREGGGVAQTREFAKMNASIERIKDFTENIDEDLTNVIQNLSGDEETAGSAKHFSRHLVNLSNGVISMNNSILNLNNSVNENRISTQKQNQNIINQFKDVLTELNQGNQENHEKMLRSSQETSKDIITALNQITKVISNNNKLLSEEIEDNE